MVTHVGGYKLLSMIWTQILDFRRHAVNICRYASGMDLGSAHFLVDLESFHLSSVLIFSMKLFLPLWDVVQGKW